MDFFALVPERNVLEEVEEVTTISQGTIDEEMSVEKQNKKSKKDKKDKKDKKKKKKKKKSKKEKKTRGAREVQEGEGEEGQGEEEEEVQEGEGEDGPGEEDEKKSKKQNKKSKKERRQDADEEGAREREGPEVQDKRQKVHGDSVPEIIEDSDTFTLAKFIEDVREPLARAKKEEKKLFLDFCGGAGDVGRRAEACHDHIGVGMDWKQGPIHVDLKKHCIYNYIEKDIVEEDLVGGAMLHCPCETWSSARHGRPGDGTPVPLRDRKEHIWGIPGLSVKDQLKLEEGNRITRACLKYRDLLRRHHVPCGLENGDLSMLWAVPEVADEMHCAQVLKISYCMMGKPFRKTTRLVVWSVKNEAVFKAQAALCDKEYFCTSPGGVCKRTGKKHLVLRGWCREGALTQWGERYPKKFVNVIAKVLCS